MHIAIYHNLHSGGAKRILFEEARLLSRHHNLHLYSLSSADQDFCDVRPLVKECQVYDFHPGHLFHSPFGRLNEGVRLGDLIRLKAVNKRIASDIDARGYDVVLVHPCQYTQGPALLHFLETPSIYYCHEPFRSLYESPPPRSYNQRAAWRGLLDRIDLLAYLHRLALKKLDRKATRRATVVLVNSQFTHQAVRRTYEVDASVAYHGIDLDTFHPLGLPKDNIVVSVGALTPNKGFDFIIESLGQMPYALRPEFVIVSNYQEPAELEHLEQMARLHDVRLTLHTLVPVGELVRLYNTAQLVVYAPILEPFGLVPLEAMACGTPVVAVREGGVRESVADGRTGLLVDRDAQAFAQAVEKLLQDRDLAARLGRQAREYVKTDWTWEKAGQELEAHLRHGIELREWTPRQTIAAEVT